MTCTGKIDVSLLKRKQGYEKSKSGLSARVFPFGLIWLFCTLSLLSGFFLLGVNANSAEFSTANKPAPHVQGATEVGGGGGGLGRFNWPKIVWSNTLFDTINSIDSSSEKSIKMATEQSE